LRRLEVRPRSVSCPSVSCPSLSVRVLSVPVPCHIRRIWVPHVFHSNRIVLALVLVHSRVIVVSVDVDEDVDDEKREEAPRALTSGCGCSE